MLNLIIIRFMETTTITELLRDPKGVIQRLEKTSEVLIERRDAAPLCLSLGSRVQAEREGTAVLAHVLVRALPEMLQLTLLWPPLVDSQPWLRLLPEGERATFIQEFAQTVEACAAIGNNSPLAQLLNEWKATAEVYAEPALLATLKRPSPGTAVRVPRPRARR